MSERRYEGETLSFNTKNQNHQTERRKTIMDQRRTQTTDIPKWSALLVEAVNKPGLIMKAYTNFHQYSVGNPVTCSRTVRNQQPGAWANQYVSRMASARPQRQTGRAGACSLYANHLQASQRRRKRKQGRCKWKAHLHGVCAQASL